MATPQSLQKGKPRMKARFVYIVAVFLFFATVSCLTVSPGWADGTVTECDRLAAAPHDEMRVSSGVKDAYLDIPAALAACRKAVGEHPAVPRFLFQYGRVLLFDGNPKSLEYLEKAAEQEHTLAQHVLAVALSNGMVGVKDEMRALEWHMRAAENGAETSQAAVGISHIQGRGVEKNLEKGIAILEKYAEEGNMLASMSLVIVYSDKDFSVFNYERTVFHLEKQVEAGMKKGKSTLGMYYVFGVGTARDTKKGVALLTERAEDGNHFAARFLATQYQNGFYLKKNEELAKYWMCRGGKLGLEILKEDYGEDATCP
jgi:TPR repeat protein